MVNSLSSVMVRPTMSWVRSCNFRHNFRQTNFFFKKIHSRGKHRKHYTSRVSYILLYPTNLQIFGIKPLPCRRFLQHYYRDTFIESHRNPTDVPEISYGGPLIYKSLFLYQRYTKGIQKASIY